MRAERGVTAAAGGDMFASSSPRQGDRWRPTRPAPRALLVVATGMAYPDTSILARTNSNFMNENSHRDGGSAGRSESRLGERTGNEVLRSHGILTPAPQTTA